MRRAPEFEEFPEGGKLCDLKLSKYLKGKGWKGATTVRGNAVEYVLNGEIIGLGVYDNRKLLYNFYIPS